MEIKGVPTDYKRKERPSKKYIFPNLLLLFFGTLLIIYFYLKPEYKEIGADYPGVVNINVTRVVNPRFPHLDESQFNTLLTNLKKDLKTHLGISVVFEVHPTIGIKSFFDLTEERLLDQEERLNSFIEKNRLDPNQNPAVLAKALAIEY
jgi:hypothetical protein